MAWVRLCFVAALAISIATGVNAQDGRLLSNNL